jgi:hypothetical protein
MHRKLMLACMAVAAFASFAGTPTASATALTEGGTTLAAGASITGTATEIKYTANSVTLTCSHMHMAGTVTANANGTFAAEFPAGSISVTGTDGGDCTSTNLGPVKWTMTSKLCLHVGKGTDTATMTGCSGSPVTTVIDITNLGISCKYEVASVSGIITTEGGGKDAEVNILEQVKKGEASNSFFCPQEMKLDMEFKLTTTDGTTLGFE